MDKAVTRVAAALIVKEGRALICRRKGGRFDGKWELPGGKLEAGESAEQACAREIYEELGLRLDALTPLFAYRYEYPDFTLEMSVLKAPVPEGGQLQLSVHSAYAFAAARELSHFDWIEADYGMMGQLAAALA